jgi:hypothetical protein
MVRGIVMTSVMPSAKAAEAKATAQAKASKRELCAQLSSKQKED